MDQLNTNGGTSTLSATPASNATETDAFYEDKIKILAQITRKGIVEWKTVDASTILTLSFARVLTAYEATFGGEKLRLTETGYEQHPANSINSFVDAFVGKGGLGLMFPIMKTSKARTNEMQSIVLSLHLLDLNGRPTFRFPNVEAIYDLFSEIKMKQSDVAGFFQAIDAAVDAAE